MLLSNQLNAEKKHSYFQFKIEIGVALTPNSSDQSGSESRDDNLGKVNIQYTARTQGEVLIVYSPPCR